MSQEPNPPSSQYPDRIIQPAAANGSPSSTQLFRHFILRAGVAARCLMLEANRSLTPNLPKQSGKNCPKLPGYSSKQQSLVSQARVK